MIGRIGQTGRPRRFRRIRRICLIGLIGLVSPIGHSVAVCEHYDVKDLFRLTRQRAYQAKFERDLRQKSQWARQGMRYAAACLKKQPEHTGCLYYQAVNQGLELETHSGAISRGLKNMIANFKSVIEREPGYDEGGAYLALSYVYLKMPSLTVLGKDLRRDLDLAQTYADKALAVAPKNPENLKLAGEVAYKKKNFTQALTYFKKALRENNRIRKPTPWDREMNDDLKKWIKKSRRGAKERGRNELSD